MPLIIYKGEVVLTIMIFKKLQKGADKGHRNGMDLLIRCSPSKQLSWHSSFEGSFEGKNRLSTKNKPMQWNEPPFPLFLVVAILSPLIHLFRWKHSPCLRLSKTPLFQVTHANVCTSNWSFLALWVALFLSTQHGIFYFWGLRITEPVVAPNTHRSTETENWNLGFLPKS